MTVYRSYDIRGIYPTELQEGLAEEVGKKFASKTNFKEVVVGCDCRVSSPSLKNALVEGLTSSGVNVIDIGQVATPILYFAIKHLDKDGGIMITASHNPKEYNGFKLDGKTLPISPAEIKDVLPTRKGRGTVTQYDIADDYFSTVTKKVKLKKKLKVVVDAGNGMAGPFAPTLLRRLGCEVIELYCAPDGTFPNHHPDPTKEKNMIALKDAVTTHQADIGFGFDGDSDRLGVIDNDGNQLTGDQVIILLARRLLEDQPGAQILSEPKISLSFFEEIAKYGGKPVLERTGHTHIKKRMLKDKIPFAGELSGHIFYGAWGFDDALYVAAKFTELVSESPKPLSELAKEIPVYYATPEYRVACPEEKKAEVIEGIKNNLSQKYDVLTIDGARVTIGNGWGLIRASNTEPVLSLRFEGKTKEDLKVISVLFEKELEKFGLLMPA